VYTIDEILIVRICGIKIFFFSSRRRHTRSYGDWSSDVCSSDLVLGVGKARQRADVAGRHIERGQAVVAEALRREIGGKAIGDERSEEHTSELQSPYDLVCRLLLEKKKSASSNSTSQSIARTNAE